MEQLHGTSSTSDAGAASVVPSEVTAWPQQRQFSIERGRSTAVNRSGIDTFVGAFGIDSGASAAVGNPEPISLVIPFQPSTPRISYSFATAFNASSTTIDAIAEDSGNNARPMAPLSWEIAQRQTIQPVWSGSLPSVPNTLTIPAGTELAASGPVGGRLIDQGVTVADGSGSPVYLAALVSRPGSYTGDVVFPGGFSPGNGPGAVQVDYAIFDASNVLPMELARLTGGGQHDQPLIDDSLTVAEPLDAKLPYGITPPPPPPPPRF